MIKRLLVAAVLATSVVPLSGCAVFDTIGKVQDVANKPVDMADLQKKAFALKSIYAGSLRVAIVYLERPRCDAPAAPVLCSDRAVVAQMVKARTVAGASVESADTAVYALGAQPTVADLVVTAAEQSVNAFKVMAATYGGSK